MFNVLSSFAEFESDTIGERAYMGMLGKARRCNYNGGTVPDGYKVFDGKLIIDEDRTRIVRLIFDMYSYGDPETNQQIGTRTIAEWLNKRGYKTKQHITKTGKILGGK
ncbi:recombinase family protein, partial [candidate division WOR-3 bacterium]|nr:recombinase family protein [candidate division WOR-3 bacterium]